LRYFNTAKDEQNREFSQGKHLEKKAKKYHITVEELKLAPIRSFDASTTFLPFSFFSSFSQPVFFCVQTKTL
jgi:hypothetical protein